ncbi:MAG: hypothetical protein RLZZ381_2054 [Cyanobacteriota bacterium]|jgi:hypothetical protein
MIVMIVDQQILSPKQVCQNCLMSDQSGLPRWHGSKLGCGKMRSPRVGFSSSRNPKEFAPRDVSMEDAQSPQTSKQAQVYECQMGFSLTWVN